ncbi:MAG: hypothetical protein IJQ73_12840 [Kiritimatiellae bacterium]|nr:hypothetical protein [Kiritimatiellia bacterium]
MSKHELLMLAMTALHVALAITNVCIVYLKRKSIPKAREVREVIVGRDGVAADSFIQVRFVESALETVANEMRKRPGASEGGAR